MALKGKIRPDLKLLGCFKDACGKSYVFDGHPERINYNYLIHLAPAGMTARDQVADLAIHSASALSGSLRFDAGQQYYITSRMLKIMLAKISVNWKLKNINILSLVIPLITTALSGRQICKSEKLSSDSPPNWPDSGLCHLRAPRPMCLFMRRTESEKLRKKRRN
jgi:hypothetical protein